MDSDIAQWSKSHPSWGTRRRIQRNHYAYLVAVIMAGASDICPACLGPMPIENSEVDKAIPALDYRPGNIVYLCHGCNSGRGILQSRGLDWPRVADYIADIGNASARVAIPTERQSAEWWQRRQSPPDTVSRYA